MGGDRDRLAIFVGAQERRIERKAREIEIVGVAAEEGRREFGCPGDPHVAVLAIGVELVLAAAVEPDDLATGGRWVATARLFKRRDAPVASLDRRFAGGGSDGLLNIGGHVADRGHHLGLLAGTGAFSSFAGGGKALGDEVVAGGRQVLKTADHAVMIGED